MDLPEKYAKYVGDEAAAVVDHVSGETVAWGWPLNEWVPEDTFDEMRATFDMVYAMPTWYIITRRLMFADLLMQHGAVRQVGVGPSGGFKWVRFEDGAVFGDGSFREGAMRASNSILVQKVECDKDGSQKVRVPCRTIGRQAGPRSVPGRRRR